ncbi:MAG: dTMP kinase [Burkholderiaceae bacterium]|nr:dTMP kinase [Burkholderiaceae bacterium]
MSDARGYFLTLEGVDGAGKSTHIEWLVHELRVRGVDVLSTREPGGTPVGEKLRALLLHEPMHLECETLLMFAARAEHVHTIIAPALERGTWVLCDRFTDATFAYQGGGRALGTDRIASLEAWLHPALQPDRTWLFDVPLAVARDRLNRTRDQDRFEREADTFFERTRAVYLDRARLDPARFLTIDATRSIEAIRNDLSEDLDLLVQRQSGHR